MITETMVIMVIMVMVTEIMVTETMVIMVMVTETMAIMVMETMVSNDYANECRSKSSSYEGLSPGEK